MIRTSDAKARGSNDPVPSRTSPSRSQLALASLAVFSLALSGCAGDDGDSDGDTSADSVEQEAFYEGKTIEIIVPSDPGGGMDSTGRMLAALLSETIEGNPTIQVINVPGGDTLLGLNQFAAREPDGLTLLVAGATASLYEIFGHADKEFSYADWSPLAGFAQGSVIYASSEAGVSGPADLLDPEGELVFGARSPEGGDLSRILALDLLDVDFEALFGFESSSATRLALQQGEVSITSDNAGAYIDNVQPLVDSGEVVPLFTPGHIEGGQLVRDPAFPDIPHVGEVYEDLHGSPPEGTIVDAHTAMTSIMVALNKMLFAHTDAPPEALEALRTAIKALPDHPDYVQAIDDVMAGYEVQYGAELEDTLAGILDGSTPDVIDWLKTYAADEYGGRLGE